jgi:hypothetical protein
MDKGNAKVNPDSVYDIEVLYNYQGSKIIKKDKYRYKFSKDDVYVFIESEFYNDKIDISDGQKSLFSETVSTEASSGVAKMITIKNIINLNSIYLRVNDGPSVCLNLFNKQNNLIGIHKSDNKIQAVFYKKTPVFD